MILFNKAEPFFNLLYLLNGMSDIIYKKGMQYSLSLFSIYLSRENEIKFLPFQFSNKMKINGKCLKMFHFHFKFSTSCFQVLFVILVLSYSTSILIDIKQFYGKNTYHKINIKTAIEIDTMSS